MTNPNEIPPATEEDLKLDLAEWYGQDLSQRIRRDQLIRLANHHKQEAEAMERLLVDAVDGRRNWDTEKRNAAGRITELEAALRGLLISHEAIEEAEHLLTQTKETPDDGRELRRLMDNDQ